MKKILLIMFVISVVFLVGCNKNENSNIDLKPNESNQMNDEKHSNVEENNSVGLKERTKEVVDFISVEDKYGIEELGFASKEHFISKAQMQKDGDIYKLDLTINSSKLFDKSEIDTVVAKAKEEGTAKLGDYTLYKDTTSLKNNNNFDEAYIDLIDADYIEDKELLATVYDKELNWTKLIHFVKTPNDANRYVAVSLMVAGRYEGFVETKVEKEMTVILDKEDFMEMRYSSGKRSEQLTVEEYYQKKDIYNVGDSQGLYGEYVNAVDFENNIIVVNIKDGGV